MCALELLRKNALRELGTWPFEIGLWVGGAATPNFMGTPGDPYGVASRVLDYKLKKTKRPPVPWKNVPGAATELSPDCFTLHPDEKHARELSISCLATVATSPATGRCRSTWSMNRFTTGCLAS